MYSLDSPLESIKGIGPKLSEKLSDQGFYTLKDLILFLPLRYSDRSEIIQIKDLEEDQLVTFKARLKSISGFYKNRRRIDTAVMEDETGKIKLMWFNNKFISKSLKQGEEYMVSGKLNNRGTITQPTVEIAKTENLHTGRLVPIYSSTLDIQQGLLRRILRHSTTQLETSSRSGITELDVEGLMLLKEALTQLHFPESEDEIVQSRERLAIEELLSLIKISEKIKEHWNTLKSAQAITINEPYVPNTIPFELTGAQKRSVDEILSDIQSFTPMNRTLVGDVGSGKTVVAGCAALQVINCGYSVAFVAPTKILADQHFMTLQKLFPTIKVELLTGGPKSKKNKTNFNGKSKLYIGTHAVINKLEEINPGLIIYDEQHRFGVKQRSAGSQSSDHKSQTSTPHTLTMSATPIPRSLMLTIFSHLKVSFIDELPPGRIPTKTWIIPERKRQASYEWLGKELLSETEENGDSKSSKLALIVCPFIDPSNHEAFANVASANEMYKTIKADFKKSAKTKKLKVGLLHGRMKKDEQKEIIEKLYKNKFDVLVTTPIVEVGVDLPTASIIVIETAERFGMASLHQLRGRVGRAGQQGYCLLFSDAKSELAKKRLKQFSKENNGLKLAELDLKNRGSGDIFGTTQSGFSGLQFASWTNFELIAKAKMLSEHLPRDWKPIFKIEMLDKNGNNPLAN